MQSASIAETVQLEDSRRVQILEFIKANPGSHLRDQSIISRRRGLYKRFYKRLDFEVEEQEILGVLFQETERDLLLYLLKTPDATQKELSEFAHISASSTSWHMKRLVQAGLVKSRRQGSFVYYVAKGDPVKILTLLKSYHPRIWERWAERLADLLA